MKKIVFLFIVIMLFVCTISFVLADTSDNTINNSNNINSSVTTDNNNSATTNGSNIPSYINILEGNSNPIQSIVNIIDRIFNKILSLFGSFQKILLIAVLFNGLFGFFQLITSGMNPISRKSGLIRIGLSLLGYFVIKYIVPIYLYITTI